MTAIRFATDKGEVGVVTVENGYYDYPPILGDLVTGHKARGASPEEFIERYADWSNGYLSSRTVEQQDPDDLIRAALRG